MSAPNSLNYNDGVDYAIPAGANQGVATSDAGLVNLTGTVSPKLRFFCNYETETNTTLPDRRDVLILNDNLAVIHQTSILATVGAVNVDSCSAMGAWHEHTIDLDPSWGSVRLRFRFQASGTNDAFDGWFVDDLKVLDTAERTIRITPDQFVVNDD
jgi:hypothetical protein